MKKIFYIKSLIIFFFIFLFFFIFFQKKEIKIINKDKIIKNYKNRIIKIIAYKKKNIYKNYKFFTEKVDEINYENKIIN
jgi:hypothetical protein